ncbi:MAG TPA: hypothetical protein VMH02_01695 [Verrucomicrobiae bacterium]|nr:hypothetical protein [Verrucomicrobiae bacterium]
MNATAAIVLSRLSSERRGLTLACVAAAVVGFLAPRGLAGPAFFCGLCGIGLALAGGPGRRPHLDACERSAPLFGRQLARAKATVPCVAAAIALLCYELGAAAGGVAPLWWSVVAALASVTATTLVALCATIRSGSSRALYLALAAMTTATAYALASSLPVAFELAFCAAAAFLALRQYGEALARYDPV